jgi:hypothetical protein
MRAAQFPPTQSPPKRALPAGAWDCHTHIFGPYERFPLAAERSYRLNIRLSPRRHREAQWTCE